MKLYFETYGCSANQNNTEIMQGIAIKHNHILVDSFEKADVILINTCIVKGPTETKIRRRIQDLQKLNKPIIIAGCMSEIRKNEIKQDKIYFLGVKHIKDLPKLLNSFSSYIGEQKEIKISIEKIHKNPVIGITQISEGCFGNCSFCATKLAKGSLYSFPEEDIIASVKSDLKKGCKEIWLTSQDNASYGVDLGKQKLLQLLRKIIALPYDFYLRLGMMNPNNVIKIKNELIEIFKHKKVYKFLHIPIQSGSNKILKKMNRLYTKKDFLYLVKEFRKEIPNITISTDIISGFPGETEKDFKETLNLLKKIKPEVLNLSKYWPMKGTLASKFKQIPREIVKNRIKKVQQIYKSFLNNSKWIGWQGRVLVNEKAKIPHAFWARNPYYKRVLINSKENLFGKFIDVKITGIKKNFLIGNQI
ncbi:MAG: tRNA (N(6)-L-threonylcarbamoyladenosine(37)-C(2))-methylthiotransferase [Candidatus Pacearchaeota archaeon]